MRNYILRFSPQGSLWRPTGGETREDWLGRHGLKKGVYEETLALVKRCKVMMMRNVGHTVRQHLIRMPKHMTRGLC